MKTRLFVSGLMLGAMLFACADAQALEGTWSASLKNGQTERLQFSMETDENGNMGTGFERTAFTGLSMEQVRSAVPVEVRFEMRREAGTIAFDGMFKNRVGSGTFAFAPNRNYAASLKRLGVELVPEEANDEQELFSLTMFDVSTEFIASMQKIGYREPLQTFVQFRIFGVDPAYVRAMNDLGYEDLSAQKLVETKIHGATPEYIRKMRASGEDLSLDEYIQSRIFDVSPEFAAEMTRAGYPNLEHETLVQFKIHDVSPEFVQEIKKLGYTKVPADQLVAMRIHGVTPEFIRRTEKAGYHKVPIEKLIQMRIFDIDPELVDALDDKRL